MDRERALRIVHRCAETDFEFRQDDHAPDAHNAIVLWQGVEPLVGVAMNVLDRLTTVKEYASRYIALQIAYDRGEPVNALNS